MVVCVTHDGRVRSSQSSQARRSCPLYICYYETRPSCP